jgi:hypothetical protein
MDTETKIPDNFRSVITDFTKDLSITFPEYSSLWSKWSSPHEFTEEEVKTVFEHCMGVFPERFFDILYQNEDIFKPDSNTNTIFLPNVDFKLLFNCEGLSENTKKTMWKYLQLLLFTVVGGVKDKTTFGDTMNMFEGIDETELNDKLKETISGISEFFSNITSETGDNSTSENNGEQPFEMPDMSKVFENMPGGEEFKKTFDKMEGLPNMENMQDHLKSLFDGKIGKLAQDMAEEISGEFKDILGDDSEDIKDTSDVVKKLMKDPKKIMDLMKKVSGKLDNKMKSGEISRDEIMKEASELFGKMKDMGGTEQFTEMFKNLTKSMGGMGKNMRMDTNALDRMTKQQATRERMLKKLQARKESAALENQMRAQPAPPVAYSLQQNQQTKNLVFRLDGEAAQEKTYIHPDLLADMENDEKATKEGKDKKKKKKKGKK